MAKTNRAAASVKLANIITDQTNQKFTTNLPAVTVETFGDLSKELTAAPPEVQNGWSGNLINLVMDQRVANKRQYEGEFRRLYGAPTYSENIQLIMVNLMKSKVYDPQAGADDFFGDDTPEIGTQYVQSVFKRVIKRDEIETEMTAAMATPLAFADFVERLAGAQFDTLEMLDVQAIKTMLSEQIQAGNFYLIPMAEPTDKATALALTQSIKTIAKNVKIEMTDKYNLAHFYTHTPEEDGIILMTAGVSATADTYALAWAFNKNYIDLTARGQFIEIPDEGLAGGAVYGGYFDRTMPLIMDKVGFPRMTSQYFYNTLKNKYALHDQKVIAVNFFADAVFYAKPDSIGLTEATLGTREGTTHVDKGGTLHLIVSTITTEAGKIADKFGTWTITGNASEDTAIDPVSGELSIASGETAAEIVATWTSHLDSTKTATETITVNGNNA